MEASEEEPAAMEPTVTSGKQHVQCKLLETIYEDPKCSKDGTEQFTSIRKYKRFIDFSEAPNNAKRWKRTQKAFKLASSRRSTAVAEPSSEISDIAASSRPTRNCTRHRLPAASARIDLVSSGCRKRPSGAQTKLPPSSVAVCDTQQHRYLTEHTGGSQQDTSLQIVVLENGDVPIEECATIEIPFDGLHGGGSRNGMLVAAVQSASEQWSQFQDNIEEDVRECVKCVLKIVVPDTEECDRDMGNSTDSTSYVPQPRQLPEVQPETRATRKESGEENEVINTVGDLAAIVETTCFLCDVSSNVADHCADVNCDTIQVAQVVREVVEVISSEQV
ncbi:uncharacterized protein LOC135368538 isoform X2 [Ornithodoros turicata]